MTHPDQITCTRCGSLVPWGPYCVQCSAYLEFAGDPPWNPDATVDQEEQPTQESVTEELAIDGAVIEAQEGLESSSIGIESEVGDLPDEFEGLFRPIEDVSVGEPDRSDTAEIVAIAVIGAGVAVLAGWVSQWWVGVAVAVFVAAWCLLLIGSRRTTAASPTVAEHPVVVYPEVDWDAPPVEEVTEILVVEPAVLEARAPQEIPSQVVERTAVTAMRTVVGDTPCAVCGRLNESNRHFCDWCGADMPGAYLGPTPAALREELEISAPQHAKPPRRLTRSWRTPIIALTLIGVFVSTIVFALFGPYAFRVQFGMTQVYQVIRQFVDPKAGTVITPVSVEASSTLAGTQPSSTQGLDGRTFWASEPSFELGAGTTLTFTLPRETWIDRMLILPGTQRSQFGSQALATPKDITLVFDDGSTAEWTLRPVDSDRDLEQLVKFPRVSTENVTVRIDTAYPPAGSVGDDYGEVAVAGVSFIAPPAPPQVLRLPTEPRSNVFGSGG